MAKKSYMDIGHGDPDAYVWLYADGRIQSVRASVGTHEQLWGMDAMNFWRGRYDEKKGEISIMPPVARRHQAAPEFLKELLELHFGVNRVYEFNNPKKF